MSVASGTQVLTLSNTQAKALAGNLLTIGAETLRFKAYDPRHPGQPPWRSGAEGKAYPLLRLDGSVAAYMKFFTRPTRKRLDRTAWLIAQQMQAWLPGLAAAPLLWAETCRAVHPSELGFDFAGYLAQAVPGETWLELKSRITDATASFPDDLRWRWATESIRALAVLERAEIVHGDLSPNNIVVDLDPLPGEPVLYLIDFDAFAAPAAGGGQTLTVGEGGSYGTDGYCPPDLAARASAGDGAVAPLVRPLWTRHAALGTALHGSRPAAGRLAGAMEPRAAGSPLRGLAGAERSGMGAGPGAPEACHRLPVGGRRSPGIDRAGGRPGAAAAGDAAGIPPYRAAPAHDACDPGTPFGHRAIGRPEPAAHAGDAGPHEHPAAGARIASNGLPAAMAAAASDSLYLVGSAGHCHPVRVLPAGDLDLCCGGHHRGPSPIAFTTRWRSTQKISSVQEGVERLPRRGI